MLSYLDMGDGTPIVFIHGLGNKKEAWKPQYELAESYRLVIPDLRGHGETTEEKDITLENMTKDIVELLQHLNIESAYICGLSLGGIIAQEFYKQRPDMVKGLILANTTSYILPFLANAIVNNAEKNLGNPMFLDKIAESNICDKIFKEEVKEAFLIRDCFIEAAKSGIGKNYFPTLFTINKPTMLIGSTNDKITPLMNIMMMHACIRRAKVIVFAETGHLSNIEQREKFNECIDNFIKKHESETSQ